VERGQPELAPAVQAKISRWELARRVAALRIRREYLSGVRALVCFRLVAGCAARALFSSSTQAEEDVLAAKAATEVAGQVERKNRIGNLIVQEAFQPWTVGKVDAYVRFVAMQGQINPGPRRSNVEVLVNCCANEIVRACARSRSKQGACRKRFPPWVGAPPTGPRGADARA
jgi:hypothetical protein